MTRMQMNVKLDAATYAVVKEYCNKHGYKIAEFIRLAIKNELNKRKYNG